MAGPRKPKDMLSRKQKAISPPQRGEHVLDRHRQSPPRSTVSLRRDYSSGVSESNII